MKYFHHIFFFLKQNFLFLFIITIRSSLSAKSNIQDSHKHILFPAFSCAWVTIYYFFACLNFFLLITGHFRGLQGGTSGKEPACQCRKHKRCGFDPWVGKISGERHGNLLQYSCLENSMDRGTWQATVHAVAKSWTWLKRLSMDVLDNIS